MTMTRQEIFIKAWNHGKTMKEMAKSEGHSTCFYRAPNGEKCLVGAFIPDEKYRSGMELAIIDLISHPVYRPILDEIGLTTQSPYHDCSIKDEEADFLEELQRCHDQARSLEAMFYNLRDIEAKYELTVLE